MTLYKSGDIVLLEYPYSDILSSKKRPALIILDTGDDDIIVLRITTQIYNTDYDVIVKDWQASNLLAPSVIRCHKIATLNKSLVFRELGFLQEYDYKNFKKVFNNYIAVN
jgi:mRNA interferase MazF